MPLRPRPPEHRASRAAEPVAPLEVPPKWMALAVPFAALGRVQKVWDALEMEHAMCGFAIDAETGRVEAVGD